MSKKNVINKLIDRSPELWKGRRPNHSQRTLPTGRTRLDACLPGGGWPLGAVTELISCKPGLGEFSLLLPALAKIGAQGQWVVLVDPPWVPYPAALHGQKLPLERLLLVRTRGAGETLWACEQALRCGHGGAVLAWPDRIDFARLRRLQLAAREHGKLNFLFRPQQAREESSPAALRLHLEPDGRHGTRVSVIKCRGSQPPEPVWIPRPFSTYGKHAQHTEQHEGINGKHAQPMLAGHPPSAPRPGPVYPRAKRSGDGDRDQQPGGSSRTDH